MSGLKVLFIEHILFYLSVCYFTVWGAAHTARTVQHKILVVLKL